MMCHVYGHNDFFKNNRYFSPTDRRMIDVMANNASRVRRYMDRHGVGTVESFIDVCLSIDNLIDPWAPFREPPRDAAEGEGEDENVHRLRNVRGYLEDYINPPDFIAEQREKAQAEKEASRRKVPQRPERDVLGFLMQHAPPRVVGGPTCSGIIREEAYYFLPQMQTKIMNEGWASYWHSKLMTERALRDSEVIDYADACAGVMSMAPGQLKPVQDRHRAVPRPRAALEHGPLWGRVGAVRRPPGEGAVGPRAGQGAREDLRGAAAL